MRHWRSDHCTKSRPSVGLHDSERAAMTSFKTFRCAVLDWFIEFMASQRGRVMLACDQEGKRGLPFNSRHASPCATTSASVFTSCVCVSAEENPLARTHTRTHADREDAHKHGRKTHDDLSSPPRARNAAPQQELEAPLPLTLGSFPFVRPWVRLARGSGAIRIKGRRVGHVLRNR